MVLQSVLDWPAGGVSIEMDLVHVLGFVDLLAEVADLAGNVLFDGAWVVAIPRRQWLAAPTNRKPEGTRLQDFARSFST